MINSRKIDDLDPEAQEVCRGHVAACKAIGIDLLITSTYRDSETQEALYAIGRTAEKHRKPVTNARGGQSWHNFRCAYDVVPLQGGKAVWDDDTLWRDIVRLGKAAGAEAGAEWKTFPDRPHFTVKPVPTLTLAQADELFKDRGTIFA